MKNLVKEDPTDRKTIRKYPWTLLAIWITLFSISLTILYLIHDASLFLYVLIASLIIFGNAICVEVLSLNPNPVKRRTMAFLIGLIGVIGIMLSWLIWNSSIPLATARYICLGAGIGMSQFTGLVLFIYFQRQG